MDLLRGDNENFGGASFSRNSESAPVVGLSEFGVPVWLFVIFVLEAGKVLGAICQHIFW